MHSPANRAIAAKSASQSKWKIFCARGPPSRLIWVTEMLEQRAQNKLARSSLKKKDTEFRLKGFALRHSVERLVLDTVLVTFGMQWRAIEGNSNWSFAVSECNWSFAVVNS